MLLSCVPVDSPILFCEQDSFCGIKSFVFKVLVSRLILFQKVCLR